MKRRQDNYSDTAGKLLAILTKTIHSYKQDDGSSVQVVKGEYDRAFQLYGENLKAGINSIGITYYSKKLNESLEKMDLKEKSF